MRLTKIYTKVGDKGTTQLATGKRISKASCRLEAYGNVDELNAIIGMIRDTLQKNFAQKFSEIDVEMGRIQHKLFDIGAELASPGFDVSQLVGGVSTDEISHIEKSIDQLNSELPPLKNFVLPGGHIVNSTAHLARTVCRRAERGVVRLGEEESDLRSEIRIYLNRLSDWLFVMSRFILVKEGYQEVIWEQPQEES